MHAVRKATNADVESLSVALARAFHDDPVMTWLCPPGRGDQQDRMRRLFRIELSRWYIRHGETYTTGDIAGGAVWAPPGKWKLGPWDMARATPATMPVIGSRLITALRGLSLLDKKHPTEPHYYLSTLGTDPARQGTGVGGALLVPVLERCDRDGIPAYLESSKERNVPYYRRFGFDVTERFVLPKGPPVWGMWRDPRPPS